MRTNDAQGACIRAVVRVRPLLNHELDRGETACCQVPDESSVLVQAAPGSEKWRKYAFDACLSSNLSQKQVFQLCGVAKLLDAAMEGYSATVLAYGQTGSGKTHTMIGRIGMTCTNPNENERTHDGLIMRSAKRLFRRVTSGSEGSASYSVSASFTEIYNAPGAVNECICDLLNADAGNLQVRHNARYGFFVSDLCVVDCKSVADVRAVLEVGVQNRRVAPHALNKDSSRSHAIFTLHVDSQPEGGDGGVDSQGRAIRRHGKISFVDLAGSERLKESLAEGNARKETQAINKSLFTLGQVISQLAQGKAEGYIPYRNSKLTQLLQESFGGGALCLMVTCISPIGAFAEESLNSLNYAQKAMKIRNRPVVHVDQRHQAVHELQAENAALRRELELYRAKFGPLLDIEDHPDQEAIGDAILGEESAMAKDAPSCERTMKVSEGQVWTASRSRSPEVRSASQSGVGEIVATPSTRTSQRAIRTRSEPPAVSEPVAPQALSASPLRPPPAPPGPGFYALAAMRRLQPEVHKRPCVRRKAGVDGLPKKGLPPLPGRSKVDQDTGTETTKRDDGAEGLMENSGVVTPPSSASGLKQQDHMAPSSSLLREVIVVAGGHAPILRAPSPSRSIASAGNRSLGASCCSRREFAPQVANAQLERLDIKPWSEWQFDFQRQRQAGSDMRQADSDMCRSRRSSIDERALPSRTSSSCDTRPGCSNGCVPSLARGRTQSAGSLSRCGSDELFARQREQGDPLNAVRSIKSETPSRSMVSSQRSESANSSQSDCTASSQSRSRSDSPPCKSFGTGAEGSLGRVESTDRDDRGTENETNLQDCLPARACIENDSGQISTASGTPVGNLSKSGPQPMSLSELKSKLSSMQTATRALL